MEDINIHEWQRKYLKECKTPLQEAKVTPDSRVAYLANALESVWNRGTGNNSIDYKSMAQSLIDDLFGTDIE
jgi:hypothetical protein